MDITNEIALRFEKDEAWNWLQFGDSYANAHPAIEAPVFFNSTENTIYSADGEQIAPFEIQMADGYSMSFEDFEIVRNDWSVTFNTTKYDDVINLSSYEAGDLINEWYSSLRIYGSPGNDLYVGPNYSLDIDGHDIQIGLLDYRNYWAELFKPKRLAVRF